jgi:hypothetical protein
MDGQLDFERLAALISAGQLQEFYGEVKAATGFKYCDLALERKGSEKGTDLFNGSEKGTDLFNYSNFMSLVQF